MQNNSDLTGRLKREKIKYMLHSAASTALSPLVSKDRSGTDVVTTPALLLASAYRQLNVQAKTLDDRKQKIDSLVEDIENLTEDLPTFRV